MSFAPLMRIHFYLYRVEYRTIVTATKCHVCRAQYGLGKSAALVRGVKHEIYVSLLLCFAPLPHAKE